MGLHPTLALFFIYTFLVEPIINSRAWCRQTIRNRAALVNYLRIHGRIDFGRLDKIGVIFANEQKSLRHQRRFRCTSGLIMSQLLILNDSKHQLLCNTVIHVFEGIVRSRSSQLLYLMRVLVLFGWGRIFFCWVCYDFEVNERPIFRHGRVSVNFDLFVEIGLFTERLNEVYEVDLDMFVGSWAVNAAVLHGFVENSAVWIRVDVSAGELVREIEQIFGQFFFLKLTLAFAVAIALLTVDVALGAYVNATRLPVRSVGVEDALGGHRIVLICHFLHFDIIRWRNHLAHSQVFAAGLERGWKVIHCLMIVGRFKQAISSFAFDQCLSSVANMVTSSCAMVANNIILRAHAHRTRPVRGHIALGADFLARVFWRNHQFTRLFDISERV